MFRGGGEKEAFKKSLWWNTRHRRRDKMINGRTVEGDKGGEERALEKRTEEEDQMTVILESLKHIVLKRN